MSAKDSERSGQAERPSGEDLLVRNVDREQFRLFCKRAESLGVPAESVLQEIMNRGIAEWLRIRSR